MVKACMLLMTLVASRSLADGGTAWLPDGSSRSVDASDLQSLQSTAWPGWLAFRAPSDGSSEADTRSMLALDDGQRVAGEFESTAMGNELRWRHRELGAVTIDLERLSWIGPPTLAAVAPPARDRLILMNGDRIEGFVNALRADRGVEIEQPATAPGAAPERTWYDLAKGLACIQLVPRGHPSTGWRCWLGDGSVLDMDGWQRVGERLVITGCHLPGVAPSVSIPWKSVRAIADPRHAVHAIAARPWTSQDVPDSPRLSPASVDPADLPGPLEVRALDLHGPGRFLVDVPKGSIVVMRVEPPPSRAQDVVCQVTLLDGERVVLAVSVDGSMKPAPVRDTIHSGQLTVRVDAGPRGAFGSSVRLSDGLVLDRITAPAIATPPSSSAPETPVSRPSPDPK